MVKVAVIGCGIVGSGVVEMFTRNQGAISDAAGADVRLTHVLDIREVPLPDGVAFTSDFEALLQDGGLSIAVETIGGTGVAYTFTKRLLQAGVSVVTSNKELVSTHGDELLLLARKNNAHYLFEASVGGGVPILRPLRTCLAGNRIERIQGIVNGSTNYLLTRMDEMGVSFPSALNEARELGYVEANPSADIEGWDARRKLNILASAAFGSQLAGDERIPTEGIARITDGDLLCAKKLGGAIKLLVHAERMGDAWTGWVHPTLLPASHPLSRVRDVFNGIVVSGDFVGDVLFSGRGAGSMPTASAVVGDIIEIARSPRHRAQRGGGFVAPVFESSEGQPARLMVRVHAANEGKAKDAVSALMPKARIEDCGQDTLALLTPSAPYEQLIENLSQLSVRGLRMGIPIRVI